MSGAAPVNAAVATGDTAAAAIADGMLGAVAQRATDAGGFDIHAHLGRVLAGIGLDAGMTGGSLRFDGADPIVPSVFRLGAAAGIGLAAKSVAMATLWRARTGEGQDIAVDLRRAPRRLCPFYERRWELLNGYPPRNPADPENPLSLAFYPARDGRWVMPLNLYPRLKSSALKLFGTPDDARAIAAAIRARDAAEWEALGAEAGVVLPMLRSVGEFVREEQFTGHLAQLPLVRVEKIGDADPVPFTPNPQQPLSGIRALGMGRVIAGAGIGRALALHGADVLNLWRPGDFEIDLLYATANVGVRSAMLDPMPEPGRAKLRELLSGADVFYANRRPELLARVGLAAEQAAALRPGLIHVTVNLHGPTGPWAPRPGFDQTAGCVSGVMNLEGEEGVPKLPPIMVVNDYLCAWLASAGVVSALMRRATEGGSWRVQVSLTRASIWLYSLGLFDPAYARVIAGSAEGGGLHEHHAPEMFEADTPLGRYRGVTDQVWMSRTPGRYDTVLVPRGSCAARWT